MKKRFLTIAIAASLAAPLSAAMAGDATLYGRAHLTLDHVTPDSTVSDSASGDGTGLSLNSRKSAIGVKGSEDLGGGMKFFFKMEWDVDMDDGNGTASVKESDAGIDINGDGDTNDTIGGGSGITARDRYIGMKTGMGTVKLGTLTSSYKETSAWVDPFWHTIAEGRGVLGMASGLAGGRGVDRGRATDTVQYRSPKMGGMQMVINRSFTGGGDENTGLGLRYTTKDIKFFWEWVGIQTGGAFNLDPTGDAISGTKIGGTFKTGGTTIGLQVENTEKLADANHTMLSVKHKVNDNDTVMFSYGMRDAVNDGLADQTEDKASSGASFALGYNHSMSKRTNVYAAVAQASDDAAGANDLDIVSFGVKHTF